MHGLGADAQDMMALAEQLTIDEPIRHVFLNAPRRAVTLNQGHLMPAWYDIASLDLMQQQDKTGILQTEALILKAIKEQQSKGIDSRCIFLAGFSQGGAMALFTGLRSHEPLGGIIALSAYVPLVNDRWQVEASKNIPLFFAAGQFDELLLPSWSAQSVEWVKAAGLNAVWSKFYPVGHAVCAEELNDLNRWLQPIIANLPKVDVSEVEK